MRHFVTMMLCPSIRLQTTSTCSNCSGAPTLSFKDVALQLVGRLFEHELERTGQTVTIVGATSGDTGSAAIEACRGRDGIELVMLHPAGRVSDVQRRQMTTVQSANIHNVAVEGTFDDCQDLVKDMFGDRPFRERNRLAAVNSINWARIAAQTVYYVTASCRLGKKRSGGVVHGSDRQLRQYPRWLYRPQNGGAHRSSHRGIQRQ